MALQKLVCLKCERPMARHCSTKACDWIRCPKCKVVVDPIRERFFADPQGPFDSGAPAS